MAQKYRKVDPRIWNDEKFRTLDAECKLVALNVLTSTQLSRIGIMAFSTALAAEQIGMDPIRYRDCIRKVCDTLSWVFDEGISVLYLPHFWRYNKPDNIKHFKGCLTDLHDVPQTPLIAQFIANTVDLPDTMAIQLRYCMTMVSPQEQEQEQEQKQEQKQKKAQPQPDAPETTLFDIPLNLQKTEFLKVWSEWEKHRAEKRSTLTPTARRKQLSHLSEMGIEKAIRAVEQSIRNGWTGIFEPDGRNGAENGQRRKTAAERGEYPEPEDIQVRTIGGDSL